MTFLNPLVLLGLAAAAIPVLLHLLNLRKLRTIEFSTLSFLKELRQSSIRKLKLRQILLLIVRTLLIIFIILAFARPALRGTLPGGFGSRATSTIAIVIDDSYSMTVADERGDRLRQAKDAAMNVIDLLKEGDEAYLIRLSDLPKVTVDPATHDLSLLKKLVGEISPSPVRRTIDEAIRTTAKLFEKTANANKEIYIVSDMQSTQFADNLPAKETQNLFRDRVGVYLVRIGTKPVPNSAIDSVAVTSSIFEPGKPVAFSTLLRNYSNAPVRNNVISVALGGTRVAQQNFSAEAWGSAAQEMEAVPKQPGFLDGVMEIENDALDFDNRRYFALSIPEVINATIVSGSPAESQFLQLALHAGRADSARGGVAVNALPLARLATLDLRTVDLLILQELTAIPRADADRIASFVKQGGGLLLFPSASTSSSPSPSPLLQALEVPAGISFSSNTEDHAFGLQRVDIDHPLFFHMFETERKDLARAATPALAITKAILTSPGKSAQVIMAMNNGSPFLTEYRVGKGRALLFAVSPSLGWSDFPLKGIFAPLLYRAAGYASGRGELLPSYLCGDEPVIRTQTSRPLAGERIDLSAPDGSEEILEPLQPPPGSLRTNGIAVAPKHLRLPGCYRLMNGKETLTMFAVNPDPRESDTRLIASDDAEKFVASFGIPTASIFAMDPGERFQERVLQSRFGVELWRHCLAIALLLAISEMAIARSSRKDLGEA